MIRSIKVLFTAFLVATVIGASACAHDSQAEKNAPAVQIALLLDTSNSMDGLIAQAKSQLWKVVNELAFCHRDGKRPTVQVALYEYGNNSLGAEGHYIRQVSPFTSDLDLISEKLFALTTNGGEEYCGAVVGKALSELKWSSRKDAYKVMFVAGNEPFTQGPVPYQETVAHAWRHGIHVNSIHCGGYQEGVSTGWLAGAQLGGGRYMSIDADAQVRAIRSPYDDEIIRLGSAINQTFVPLGSVGKAAESRANVMDRLADAKKAEGASAERSLFKASRQYGEEWDAVAAVQSGRLSPASIPKQDLPAELQKKSSDEIVRVLESKSKERGEIQTKLSELQRKRQAFIVEAEKGQTNTQTLDKAMLEAVREQAGNKNFMFKS